MLTLELALDTLVFSERKLIIAACGKLEALVVSPSVTLMKTMALNLTQFLF